MSVRVLLVIVAFTASADADSPTWSRSSMTAATSYFPAHASVLVAGIGDAAQPVATALVEALQVSDAFEYAIDAKGMGKLDALSDADIVKRAFTRPLKRLAIVRVFPAGGSVKAVVTVYAAQGQVTTAFTLAPGKTLAENPTPETATDGVRSDELQVVKSTAGTASDDDDIRYERRAVTGVSFYGLFTRENVNFFKGDRLLPDTPALYDAMGMADKANAYRSQAKSHHRYVAGGAVLATLGTIGVVSFGLWALVPGHHEDAATNSYVSNDNTLPVALTAASAGALTLGWVLIATHGAPKDLTTDEAIALVDAHNKKKRASVQLRLSPSATPSGGGLALGGSF